MRVGEREIQVVVTQCLLLLTGRITAILLHNGGTDIALYPGRGGGGGGGGGGA